MRIGIDVGGTFTDALAFDPVTGQAFATKVPSTPDPADGFFGALDTLLTDAGRGGDRVDFLAHGTTAATNALIEGRHARVALVTNRGFRDLLEIGYQSRPSLYEPQVRRAPPLVARQLCFEIAGRLGPDGAEEEPLEIEELRRLGRELAALEPALEAVAVCLLHSYRDDAHERAVVAALSEELEEAVFIQGSAAVSREFREYPRASTAVVNAAVAPLMDRYLGRVGAGLVERGISCGLHVMQSNGGLVAAGAARARPAFAVESGPAAAAIGAASVAAELGLTRALALDIGGTTAKVAVVVDGQPAIAPELEVGPRATADRLGRGGGYPLRTPCVDLVEIGAGGGSVGWRDAGGALRVGPRSAGAVPGPACYPAGGEEPTLTDANLVLGRLDGDRFLGGAMRLRPEAAEAALARLGDELQQDAVTTAAGVVAVAVDAMAAALRLATVDKGHDPRDFALVALGGAGPLHACEIAGAAGIGRVAVPPRPGLGSSLGLLVTDLKVEAVVSWPGLLAELDQTSVGVRLDELEAELREELRRQGVREAERIEVTRALDLRYLGQSFELSVPWRDPADAERMFHGEHRRRYGFAAAEELIELVALRVTALGRVGQPPRLALPEASAPPAPLGSRAVVAADPAVPVRAALHDRGALAAGHRLLGPALIFEHDATTWLPPGWTLNVQPAGHLLLELT